MVCHVLLGYTTHLLMECKSSTELESSHAQAVCSVPCIFETRHRRSAAESVPAAEHLYAMDVETRLAAFVARCTHPANMLLVI
jgi:hypothetical protein